MAPSSSVTTPGSFPKSFDNGQRMTLTWKYESTSGDQAGCVRGSLTAPWQVAISPAEPQRGIQFIRSGNAIPELAGIRPLPSHALQIEETYSRGTDCITRFDQTGTDEYSFQLNYRLLPSTETWAGIELWLSVQTDQLDSTPVIAVDLSPSGTLAWHEIDLAQHNSDETLQHVVSSQATSTENAEAPVLVGHLGDTVALLMLAPADRSGAGLVVHQAAADQHAGAVESVNLFQHFMEKGVIRRARLQLWLTDATSNLAQLKATYERFVNSPLPLTA